MWPKIESIKHSYTIVYWMIYRIKGPEDGRLQFTVYKVVPRFPILLRYLQKLRIFHSADLISSGFTSTILSSSTPSSEFAAEDSLSSSISATCGSTFIRSFLAFYFEYINRFTNVVETIQYRLWNKVNGILKNVSIVILLEQIDRRFAQILFR